MGQLHNELNPRSNISRAVRLILGSLDHEGGVERFSETLDLQMDLWSRVEWALPRGEIIWEATPTAAAVAGNISWVGIVNPLNSGNLVVIDGYQIVGQTPAQDVQVSYQSSGAGLGGAVGSPFAMDTRRFLASTANNTVTILLAAQQAAVFGTNFRHHIIPAGTDDTPTPLGIVLKPGSNVTWQTTAQNVAIQVNIRGREWRAAPSEFVV